jgi:hypothetical protein
MSRSLSSAVPEQVSSRCMSYAAPVEVSSRTLSSAVPEQVSSRCMSYAAPVEAHEPHEITEKLASLSVQHHQPSLNLKAVNCLFGSYQQRFAPSQWVQEQAKAGLLDAFLGSAVVLHDSHTPIDVAKQLATQREPTNIGMQRMYDETKLKELDYSRGCYAEHQHNIAVYCESPAVVNGLKIPLVKVLNVVAPATDSDEQPDFQALEKLPKTDRQVAYEKMLEKPFCFIAHHVVTSGTKKLVMTAIGQGAFADGAGYLGVDTNLAFLRLSRKYFGPEFLKASGCEVVFANCQFLSQDEFSCVFMWLNQMLVDYSKGGNQIGFTTPVNIEDVLFVNAWDPWSVIGNGNAGDRSLDGFWGSYTAMSFIGTPSTNPSIQYKECKFD